MTSREATRKLRGRIVKTVELRPFRDGRGGFAHSPVIFFTDGTALSFVTHETESTEYGTSLIIHTPPPES